jgi:hypothetical protein
VRDYDKSETAPGRHGAEQLLQRFQATRRRADADDRKISHAIPRQ